MIIRAKADAATLASAATRMVRGIVPQNPIERVLTVDQIRYESVGPRRLNALLVGSFGLLALVVASIGIAAVLAFSVVARTHEIGIRMSLGVDSGRVQRMILSEGCVLVAAGLLLATRIASAVALPVIGLYVLWVCWVVPRDRGADRGSGSPGGAGRLLPGHVAFCISHFAF